MNPLTLTLTLAAVLAAPPQGTTPTAVPLSFRELFEPSGRELKPSPHLQALSGQRVTLVGFMVKMEIPPRGGFYLTPDPVDADESGGGTADLPPSAVFVIVRSNAGEVLPWVPRRLQVTGVLDVSPRPEEDGRTTFLRLTLDRREDLTPATPSKTRSEAPKHTAKTASTTVTKQDPKATNTRPREETRE